MIHSKQLVAEYIKTIGHYTYDQRDCIGSIFAILKEHGSSANIIGSNWFARYELIKLRPLTSRAQLYDGCAVLKTLHRGESGYNLPPRYRKHIDLMDYHHIGIGTDDGRILDSTRYGKRADGSWTRNGPGISTAKIGSKSWDIIADFPPDMVDYSDSNHVETDNNLMEVFPMEYANVFAKEGSTVRLRKEPSTKSIIIANVPIGASVGVLEKRSNWWHVSHAGNNGWMMSEFLRHTDASDNIASPSDSIILTIPKSAAQALFYSLKSALDA